MKRFVLGVRDSAAQAFGQPMFVPAVGLATRSFTDEVNRRQPDNPAAAHPEDYELWYLGEFDDETGEFSCQLVDRKCVLRGKDAVNKEV